MLDFDHVAGFRRETDGRAFSIRDTCLYGLSVSPACEPDDEMDLDLVLETRGPKILPTMASVLAESLSRFLGLDMRGVTHAQQQLICHRPLPQQGDLVIEGHVTAVLDKGAEKGALVTFENVATLKGETIPLFTLANTLFARRDGGFGRNFGDHVARHIVPARDADLFERSQTRVPLPIHCCMPSRRLPPRPVSRGRSCTASAPMAWPAVRSFAPCSAVIRRPSIGSMSASLRLSIRERPCIRKSGSMAI